MAPRIASTGGKVIFHRASTPMRRVYVWELPVRIWHWVMVVSMAVLAATGCYIHDPFLVTREAGSWTMGTARYVHIVTGFIFAAGFLLRLYWFYAGNRWARFQAFLPIGLERHHTLREMLKYYTFFRWRPPAQIGHNTLAALSYLGVYTLVAVEIVIGLVLLRQPMGHGLLAFTLGWLPRWIDIQWLRTIHYFIMWAFGIFFIHHLYSAIVVSAEEKSALLDSIFTGYKSIEEEHLKHGGLLQD